MTATMTDRLYTVQDLAELFKMSPQTVWAHVRAGDWPHWKPGPRTIRFTEDHITQILAQHDRQPQPHRPSRRRRTT